MTLGDLHYVDFIASFRKHSRLIQKRKWRNEAASYSEPVKCVLLRHFVNVPAAPKHDLISKGILAGASSCPVSRLLVCHVIRFIYIILVPYMLRHFNVISKIFLLNCCTVWLF
jgi:hypothetical protein